MWTIYHSASIEKQFRRPPHFIHAFLRGEYLDLTHKLEDPAVKGAARIYFDRCEKMILVAWLNRNIFTIVVNYDAHQLIAAKQIHTDGRSHSEHIHNFIGVRGCVKFF